MAGRPLTPDQISRADVIALFHLEETAAVLAPSRDAGASVSTPSRSTSGTRSASWVSSAGPSTEEWMAFFDDPDGQPLALMSQVRPAANAS